MPFELRITDAYIKTQLAEIQAKRGDSTATRTANAILLQALPFIDERGDFNPHRQPSAGYTANKTTTPTAGDESRRGDECAETAAKHDSESTSEDSEDQPTADSPSVSHAA